MPKKLVIKMEFPLEGLNLAENVTVEQIKEDLQNLSPQARTFLTMMDGMGGIFEIVDSD